MKIAFSQLYVEPGASFKRLDGPLLGAMRAALDGLGKNIDQLSSKFAGEDFELVFVLSARSDLDSLEIKGPNIRRKAQAVEFSLFLPWQKATDFKEEIEYVLPKISEGIVSVLTRYEVDASGVDAAIRNVLREARVDPKKFQFPNRPANF